MRFYEIYAWTECPYCIKAKELLISRGEQFIFCCIDQSDELLAFLKEKYNWQTVPMIIEKNTDNCEEKFIGGYTDLSQYFDAQECESD